MDTMRAIDRALAKTHPDVFDTLRPGATDEALERLRRQCFGVKALPQELELLFRWHDGQEEDGVVIYDENRTFLPIEQVVEFHRFLADPEADILRPYLPSWIPLTWNGAGDHLVYVSSGEDAGALWGYWHDDPDQGVEYDTLQEWLDEVLGAAETDPES